MKRLENGSLAKNMMARRRRARFWGAVKWARRRRARFLEYWPAAGGLDFGELSSGPAAGGLDFGVLARRRRARFRRGVKCGPPQAGSVFTNSFKEMGFIIVLKYPLTSTYSDL